MTLLQYLLTIDADYETPGTKLKVFEDPVTKEDISSAGRLPYAIIEALDDNERIPLYGNQAITDQVIDVALYQEPSVTGETPAKEKMMVVWDKVKAAGHNVTENTFKRPFHFLEYVTGVEPRYDPPTKGLFGSVRFRIHSSRG